MTGEALSSIAHLSDVENSEEPDEDNENSRMSILYAMEGTDISGAPLVQTDLQQKEEELFTLRKALSLTFFDITSLKLKAESIQSAIQDSQSCDVSSVQSLLDDIFSLRTHIADSYALPTVDPPSLVHSDCSLPDELSSVDELERSIDTLRTVVDENGSVLDHLQTIHLDFEKEYAALPQRLSALHANNAHLHSIIDDHATHIQELNAEITQKDEEIAKLKDGFINTISSMDAQTESQDAEDETAPTAYDETQYQKMRETSMQLEKELSRCRAENKGLKMEMEANSIESTLLAKDARIASLEMKLNSFQTHMAQEQQQWEKERQLAQWEKERDQLQIQCLKAVGNSVLGVVSLLEDKLTSSSPSMRLLSPSLSVNKANVSSVPETALRSSLPEKTSSPPSPPSSIEKASSSPSLSSSYVKASSPKKTSSESSRMPSPEKTSSPPAPVMDTILGPVSVDDPASIQRLLRRMSLRVSMAEAKAESIERSRHRDELMRQQYKQACDELVEVKSELQRLRDEGSRKKDLRRTVEVLRRNETVYKEALRELKVQMKEKDRQLREFQSVFDGLHKPEDSVRV